MNANEQERTVENAEKGTDGGQTKRSFGKTDVRYWDSKLKKRRYLDRNGDIIEVPNWQVRLKHIGKEAWFNLGAANKRIAAEKARDIHACLLANGWEPTLAKFKPKAEEAQRFNCTVGDYLTAAKNTGVVRLRTFIHYANCLRLVTSEIFGVRGGDSRFDYRQGGNQRWVERIDRIRLARLTPDRVRQWKAKRLKKAGNSPVAIASAQRTINSYIRCSRSLFTKEIREQIKTIVLPSPLPFEDVELFPQGDMRYKSRINNVHALIAAARNELKANDPEAYKVFLLSLFAGMRKGEIDLAEWGMVDFEKHLVRLEETQWLHLKTKDSAGEIPIDPEVSSELKTFKSASRSEFVISSDRPPRNDSARAYYRCDPIFDRLTNWLRSKGVKAHKPLHEMRKEIGALVATQHGIFAASTFLRHSDITTTSRHYAEHKTRISVGLGSSLLDTEIKPVQEVAP